MSGERRWRRLAEQGVLALGVALLLGCASGAAPPPSAIPTSPSPTARRLALVSPLATVVLRPAVSPARARAPSPNTWLTAVIATASAPPSPTPSPPPRRRGRLRSSGLDAATWSGPTLPYGSPSAGPQLAILPASLTFSTVEGGPPPRSQEIVLYNPGQLPVRIHWHYRTIDGHGWLPRGSRDILPTSVSPGSQIRLLLIPDSRHLSAGLYHGVLTLTARDASGGRVTTVPILLVVRPARPTPTPAPPPGGSRG